MPRPSRRLWVGVGRLVAVLAIAAWQSSRFAPDAEPIHDPVRQRAEFVQQDTASCSKTACSTRTWAWNGQAWGAPAVAHPALLPLTRYGSSAPPMAFDHARGTMLLFVSAN